MADKKWYIAQRSAEGNAVFFVKLSPEELKVIQMFLDKQDEEYDEGYSGDMSICKIPFNTKKQAFIYARNHHMCSKLDIVPELDDEEEDDIPTYPCSTCCPQIEWAFCCGCQKEREWQEKYGKKDKN